MDELASNPRLQSLRDQLDEIDVKIVRTLNERARLLHDLATVKGEAGAQLFDPQREEEILQRVAEENPGPIYDSTMREIFAVIMHRIRDKKHHTETVSSSVSGNDCSRQFGE